MNKFDKIYEKTIIEDTQINDFTVKKFFDKWYMYATINPKIGFGFYNEKDAIKVAKDNAFTKYVLRDLDDYSARHELDIIKLEMREHDISKKIYGSIIAIINTRDELYNMETYDT